MENSQLSTENLSPPKPQPKIELSTATPQEMLEYADALRGQIKDADPAKSELETLHELADRLPSRLPQGLPQQLQEQAQTSKEVRQVIITYYLRTILKILEPFFTLDQKRKDDLFQSVILHILEKISEEKVPATILSLAIPRYTLAGIGHFYSQEYGVKASWVTPNNLQKLQQMDTFAAQSYASASNKQLLDIADILSKDMGVEAEELLKYLKSAISTEDTAHLEDIAVSEDTQLHEVEVGDLERTIVQVLTDPREKENERDIQIFLDRFGFRTGEEKNLEELAEIYGITRSRVQVIEKQMLRKIHRFRYLQMSKNPPGHDPFLQYNEKMDSVKEFADSEGGRKADSSYDSLFGEVLYKQQLQVPEERERLMKTPYELFLERMKVFDEEEHQKSLERKRELSSNPDNNAFTRVMQTVRKTFNG